MADAQLLNSGKLIGLYTSYSLIFNPLHSIINREQHGKHLYKQSSHYRKYIRNVQLSKHVPPLSIRCVAWYHYMLHFQLLRTAFQAKNNIRSTTASIAPTQVSYWSHNTCTANHHLHDSVERDGEQRLPLVEPWCTHWSCCSWWKSTSRDKVMLNSEEIEPIAIVIIISQSIR